MGSIFDKSSTFLFLACILAGFALTKVNLVGTFLEDLGDLIYIIGVIAIIIFSFVLIYLGVRALFGSRKG